MKLYNYRLPGSCPQDGCQLLLGGGNKAVRQNIAQVQGRTADIEEERGTEVAAAEQKENTTGTPDENGNYLINGSFEEPDFSGWTVTNNNDVTEELDVYDRETDCFAGAQSLHFYSGNNPVDFP